MATTLEFVKQDFENNLFFQHIGFEVVDFKEDRVKIKLKIQDELLNTNGTLHGGVYATMLDFIQGMLLRAVTKEKCVTTNLTTHFLASVSSGEIFAEAKILQQGYKLAFIEGEITDAEGRLLGKGTGTFKIIREK
ncbi:PaaI family thioesterase [Bacillus sp. REN10]|uniref:PaaI family thioesterase n=1 Tax=Bacillus sp. REN10 TaxID=2782541 RepID=UPI00193B6969|nr:PaaI family thioesterase [Bacillus sp. REN10]